MKKNKGFASGRPMTEGFIGLIALLISVGIIAFLIVRSDLLTPKGQKSFDEIRTSAIDDARNAKALIEERDREALEEANY